MVPVRRTNRVPKEDVVFPDCCTVIHDPSRLVAGALRLSIGTPIFVVQSSRLVVSAPRYVTSAHRFSQINKRFSAALRGIPKLITITSVELLLQSSEIPVTPKDGRNALLVSVTILILTSLC